jgi:hypothetical protein
MPPLPTVPAVLKAQLLWNDSTDTDVTSTLFFSYSGTALTGASALALADDIFGAMASNDGLWGSAVGLNGCKVQDLSTDTGGEGTASGTAVGTRTGAQNIASASLLVNYSIDRRYRGGKPRNYLPWGVDSDLATAQTWDGSFLSSAGGALTEFFTGVLGSTSGGATISNHVNVSYYQGFTVDSPAGKRAKNVSTPRAVPLVNTITSFTTAARVGSQRRRLGRS